MFLLLLSLQSGGSWNMGKHNDYNTGLNKINFILYFKIVQEGIYSANILKRVHSLYQILCLVHTEGKIQ